jgi:hypothetical protein
MFPTPAVRAAGAVAGGRTPVSSPLTPPHSPQAADAADALCIYHVPSALLDDEPPPVADAGAPAPVTLHPPGAQAVPPALASREPRTGGKHRQAASNCRNLLAASLRCGDVESALFFMEAAEGHPRGVLTVEEFNGLIQACAERGWAQKADACFAKLRGQPGRAPNTATFRALIEAHARGGNAASALTWLKAMAAQAKTRPADVRLGLADVESLIGILEAQGQALPNAKALLGAGIFAGVFKISMGYSAMGKCLDFTARELLSDTVPDAPGYVSPSLALALFTHHRGLHEVKEYRVGERGSPVREAIWNRMRELGLNPMGKPGYPDVIVPGLPVRKK